MLSYHSRVLLADKALESLKLQHPALIETMDVLRAHYLEGGVQKPSPHLLIAAARLITAPNYREAALSVSRDLGMSNFSATTHIIDAVNYGPDFFKDEEVLLHGKGIVRASDRYLLSRPGIHAGSVYDRAWHAMDPAYRPIIAAAVQDAICARGPKRALEPRTMNYIAICLMPDDNQKYFELNSRSIDRNAAHNQHLEDALCFISDTAEKHGIKIPQDFLENIEKSASYTRPAPAIPYVPKIPSAAEKARRDFMAGLGKHLTSEELRIRGERLRKLAVLFDQGHINKFERDVYIALHPLDGSQAPSLNEIAQRYEKTPRNVGVAMAHLEKRLDTVEITPEGVLLEGKRHQSRAVRP